MKTSIFAKQALLPTGWTENVLLEINDTIISTVTDSASNPGDAVQLDLLLPAPANLHSHAFQRAMAGMTESRGPDPTDSFWTWRRLMYLFLDQLTPDDIESITALVQMEMLESGYAAVGEFHYLHHQSDGEHYTNIGQMSESIACAASLSGIGLTLLPVLYEHGGCDGRPLGPGQCRFGNTIDSFSTLFDKASIALANLPSDTNIGVAPHSLRAVSREALSESLTISPETPFHLHLAEQELEVEEILQAWGQRPVEWLLNNHNVDERWCLIHCTQMQPHETSTLAKTGAVAGLCPITESNLGDGIFDGLRYLKAGGRIGVGSDSNIRISLNEELRTLEYSQRLRDRKRAVLATEDASTGRVLFDATTQGGAQACKRHSGSLAPGYLADLLALNTDTATLAGLHRDQLLDSFIFASDHNAITDVWSAGRHMVTNGYHIHREQILTRYLHTLNSLKTRIHDS